MDMMRSVLYAYPPVKPDTLSFNSLTGELTWTDKSLSETKFVVQRSVDGGLSWGDALTVDRFTYDPVTGDIVAPLPPATKGEVLTRVVPGWVAGNLLRVLAVNVVGDTHDYSAIGNNIPPNTYAFPVATVQSASDAIDTTLPPTPPVAPIDLTATAETGPQVSLAWTDIATDETGYLVQRATDGVTFADIATLGPNAFSYVDTAVVAGTTYIYRVAPFNAGGPAYSNTASATIPGPQPPAAPLQLQADFQDTPRIDLSWQDVSLDETSFLIQRSTDGVTFADLATVGANVVTYSDIAVFGGITYTYQVASVNANGTSFSNTANASVPPDATPPAAPSGLAASTITATSFRVTWLDNSNNETGFTVQRATNSGFTKNVVNVNVGANLTVADLTGLKANTTYYVRVLAFNGFNAGAGPFPWSATLSVKTLK
jgi:hypothetical protein